MDLQTNKEACDWLTVITGYKTRMDRHSGSPTLKSSQAVISASRLLPLTFLFPPSLPLLLLITWLDDGCEDVEPLKVYRH